MGQQAELLFWSNLCAEYANQIEQPYAEADNRTVRILGTNKTLCTQNKASGPMIRTGTSSG